MSNRFRPEIFLYNEEFDPTQDELAAGLTIQVEGSTGATTGGDRRKGA